MLTGSERYMCEKCKTRNDSTKKFTIIKLPEVRGLVVSLVVCFCRGFGLVLCSSLLTASVGGCARVCGFCVGALRSPEAVPPRFVLGLQDWHLRAVPCRYGIVTPFVTVAEFCSLGLG